MTNQASGLSGGNGSRGGHRGLGGINGALEESQFFGRLGLARVGGLAGDAELGADGGNGFHRQFERTVDLALEHGRTNGGIFLGGQALGGVATVAPARIGEAPERTGFPALEVGDDASDTDILPGDGLDLAGERVERGTELFHGDALDLDFPGGGSLFANSKLVFLRLNGRAFRLNGGEGDDLSDFLG